MKALQIANKSRESFLSVIRITWPIIAFGVVIILVLTIEKDRLESVACQTSNRIKTCSLLFDYAVTKGAAFDLAMFLIGAPLFLAVFIDRIKSVLYEAFSDALMENPSTSEILKMQISKGLVNQDEVRSLLHECFLNYGERKQDARGQFGEFIIRMLDEYNEAATTPYRSGFNTTLIIREPEESDPGFYLFNENMSFETHAIPGDMYPLYAVASLVAKRDELEHLLLKWAFVVEFEKFKFDLAVERADFDYETLLSGQGVQSKCATLSYNGSELTIVVSALIPVETKNPRLSRTESGLMSINEREYTTALKYPTRGVEITVQLPKSMRFNGSSFTPIQLHWPATQTVSTDGTHIQQTYKDWLLPGLCSVVMWEERPDIVAEAGGRSLYAKARTTIQSVLRTGD